VARELDTNQILTNCHILNRPSLVEGGKISIKLAAQNSEGIPLLGYRIKRVFDDPKTEFEGEVCKPWGSKALPNRDKRFFSVSVFENCIPFVIRNATEFVYKVGLGEQGAKLIDGAGEVKGKRGNAGKVKERKKSKKEKRRIEALHQNATNMLQGLEASKRRGIDFTLNNFMSGSSGKSPKGFDYSFQTSIEHISHDLLEGENVLCSTLSGNWKNHRKLSVLGQHRISTQLSSGLRFPSLGLGGLGGVGIGEWREWRGLRGWKGGGSGSKKIVDRGEIRTARKSSLKHVVYEKPRFSRLEITTVSGVPIVNKAKKMPSIQLAMKNIITSGFNSSLPLHMRDMNGFKLGKGVRGWKPNEHGPFTEGLRSTVEFRIGGDTSGLGLCCVLFGDFMCFSRVLRVEPLPAVGAEELKGFKEKMKVLKRSYNAKTVTKTATGVGVRFKVKNLRIKADVASLNSGQTKFHVGVGRDFTTEFDEDCDFNGI
jgi:hypothetical protein